MIDRLEQLRALFRLLHDERRHGYVMRHCRRPNADGLVILENPTGRQGLRHHRNARTIGVHRWSGHHGARAPFGELSNEGLLCGRHGAGTTLGFLPFKDVVSLLGVRQRRLHLPLLIVAPAAHGSDFVAVFCFRISHAPFQLGGSTLHLERLPGHWGVDDATEHEGRDEHLNADGLHVLILVCPMVQELARGGHHRGIKQCPAPAVRQGDMMELLPSQRQQPEHDKNHHDELPLETDHEDPKGDHEDDGVELVEV
mmetsp:Transcript_15579/g.34697  ORF Transcript_15579/g.34697 Transcript_15579/m.34697 type:complete len:255 (-) Transcript_15579:244-1008(-)